MPNIGTLPSSFSTWEYVPETASGSPGPLLKNTPSGCCEHVLGRRVPRHARDRASGAHEPVEDGALHTAIVGDNVETACGRLGQGEPHAIGHRGRYAHRGVRKTPWRPGFAHDASSLTRTFASKLSTSSSTVEMIARWAP